MKLRITMKSPDAVAQAIQDYVQSLDPNEELDRDAWEINCQISDVERQLKKWVKYNEYITVEIDLENNTAQVIPIGA